MRRKYKIKDIFLAIMGFVAILFIFFGIPALVSLILETISERAEFVDSYNEGCDCEYELTIQRDELMQEFEKRLDKALRYYRYDLGDGCYIYDSPIYYKCDQSVVEEARSALDEIKELLRDIERGNI